MIPQLRECIIYQTRQSLADALLLEGTPLSLLSTLQLSKMRSKLTRGG